MTDKITATRRTTGSKTVHEVTDWYGKKVATRRSDRTYDYAICRRVSPKWTDDGRATVTVERWSNSGRCSSSFIAVKVEAV